MREEVRSLNEPSVDRIRDIASEWVVKIDEADAVTREELIQRCEAWQSEHPLHRKFYHQIQQVWTSVTPETIKPERSRVLPVLTSLIIALLLITHIPWQYLTADYKTFAGETREITLPDGSQAILNTNSAINVIYSNEKREVSLIRGEVLVDVKKNKFARQFAVESRHLSAVALGTRYSVKATEKSSMVRVYESQVEVTSKASKENPINLSAGEQVEIFEGHVGPIQSTNQLSPDWLKKQLVFHDEPLEFVLDRLSEYHTGNIFLDEHLRSNSFRFTGVLPVDDFDQSLSILSTSLNLSIDQWSPYIILIKPDA